MPISVAGNKLATPSRRRARSGSMSERHFVQNGFLPKWRSAENGFTPIRRFAENGFTLVELMVVVALMAVASALVMLALPDPRGRLDDDAARFAARTRAAHDMAIVEGRSVSVWVADGGYGFDRHEVTGWQAIAEKPLRVTHWASGVRADVAHQDGTNQNEADQAGPNQQGRARVIFDSTGFANIPLDVELRRGDERATIAIGSDGSVRLHG